MPTQSAKRSLPPTDGSVASCKACDGSGVDEHEIRCIDCFGSGILGDGLLQMLASEDRALEVICPTCDAGVGRDCERGVREPDQVLLTDAATALPVEGVHTRRMRVAIATLDQRPERRAA